MKNTMDYLCWDDEKIIRHQIIFGKPRAEVIHFMVNQFGVPRDDAEKIHDRIAVDVRNNQKNIRWGK